MHLNFKKYYFINDCDTKVLDNQDKQTSIIYRNYSHSKLNKKLLINLRDYCRKKKLRVYLSNDFKLALDLKFDGAYIPSFNKSKKHLSYSIGKNFEIIGSAHNIQELRIKEIQNVSQIIISSIFKRNKNFLGIYKFQILRNMTNKNVIPLGGIKSSHLNFLKTLKFNGLAGISFFQKKRPLQK